MKKCEKLIFALALCLMMSAVTLTTAYGASQNNPFTDIKENSYYYDAVLWANEEGITTGRTADKFCPKDNCTRGQVVTFLWRAAGKPEPESMVSLFSDVSQSKNGSYYKAILWAAEENIASGFKNGTFQPTRPVTRAEFLTFLYRYNDYPTVETTDNPFVDVDPVKHKNFETGILWAYENNITGGKDETHFQPDAICSRANVVTFMYRNLVSDLTVGVHLNFVEEVDMWKDLVKAYEEETGNRIKLITVWDGELGEMLEAGENLDVILDAELQQELMETEKVADLTDVMELTIPGETVSVQNKLVGDFTDNKIFHGYGDEQITDLPFEYAPYGLYYNAGLFKEKGWKVPETWEEMWELGDKAKEEGIALFTYPTAGYIDSLVLSMIRTAFGDDYTKVLNYEEGIWETDAGEKIFSVVEKLMTYTYEDTVSYASDQSRYLENQQLLLDNRVLFIPNGSWFIAEMSTYSKADGFEWGIMATPAFEEGGKRASYSFSQKIWMPTEAENKDAGKEFLAFLYSDAATILMSDYGYVQPIKGVSEKISADNALIYTIYDDGAIAMMDSFASFDFEAADESIYGVFCEPFDKILLGELTVSAWKEQVIAANDLFRANMIK